MATRDLRRRLSKIITALHCPNCGFELPRRRVDLHAQGHEQMDEYAKIMADATDEELREMGRIYDRIQARHKAQHENATQAAASARGTP